MLHLETKPFTLTAADWSGQLQAASTISTSITYWNLKNSHWEPLFDPWEFTLVARKESSTSALSISMTSRALLDVNLSSSFVELAVSTMKVWSREGDKMLQRARGSYAPYRIRNRTGGPISIWSDSYSSSKTGGSATSKIPQGGVVEWRFDDWRSLREVDLVFYHAYLH